MSLKVVISHKTHYKYDKAISLSPHIIRLRPAPHSRTPIEAYSLKIKPDNHFLNWQQDPFGNYQARVVFPEKTKEFFVDVEIIADMITINPFDFFVEESATNYPFKYKDDLRKELKPYLKIEEDGKLLKEFVKKIDKTEKPINDFLVEVICVSKSSIRTVKSPSLGNCSAPVPTEGAIQASRLAVNVSFANV